MCEDDQTVEEVRTDESPAEIRARMINECHPKIKERFLRQDSDNPLNEIILITDKKNPYYCEYSINREIIFENEINFFSRRYFKTNKAFLSRKELMFPEYRLAELFFAIEGVDFVSLDSFSIKIGIGKAYDWFEIQNKMIIALAYEFFGVMSDTSNIPSIHIDISEKSGHFRDFYPDELKAEESETDFGEFE